MYFLRYIIGIVVLACYSNSLKITKFLSIIGSSSLLLTMNPINTNAIDGQKSVYIGQYRDPAHPGCSRIISSKESGIIISGSDHKNGAGKWAIKASEDKSGSLLVDFTNGVLLQDWHSPSVDFPGSFEGRQDVIGNFDSTINGIKWNDGTNWYKTNIATNLVDGSGSGFTSSKYKSL